MEIQVQKARDNGRMVYEEESQAIPADGRAPLSRWGEKVRRHFGQQAEAQIFLFSYGRKLKGKPGQSKSPANRVSFSQLGIEPGEEFLYIVANRRRSTYRCRVTAKG